MYGKPPPLPPPIPNEPPSFHPVPPPPPPSQPPPPPPPHNEPYPSHAVQMRPPFPSNSSFGGFVGPSYQQPLQYPIPYNAQQLQYSSDYSRTFQQVRPPQPVFVPGYNNPAIRPLMPPQFDQPPPRFNQSNQLQSQLDHGNQSRSQFEYRNQPASQFDQNKQPPSQFDHNDRPASQFDQNDQSRSQFDCNDQPASRFDHNSASQFDCNQPPSQFDHNSRLSSQFDRIDHSEPTSQFDNQPPSQFDHNIRTHFDHSKQFDNQPPSQFDHNQPTSRFEPPSQLNSNKQSPQLSHTAQFDHQRQYDHDQQPSQLQSIETRRLPYYQLPSGSDTAGPKPLMDLPQVPLSNKELMKEPHGAGSSDQRPVADATVNNGNTNFHPVPCHIAAQHKPAGQRRTLLPGNPYQWTPHHSERSRYGGGYYSGHDLGPSEYDDDDDYQPYHSLDTVEREQEIEREREVEKPPPKTVSAEVLFGTVDQRNRPTHFVIILRGLPGSGKTYAAKLIKEKELANEFSAPRILSLDDYFLVEVEKKVTDPISGKKVKKKVTEYEYDAPMEEHYRASLFKSFNKTLDDGYFPVIVIDAINHKVSHFYQCWSAAKMKGFEVYICEMNSDIDQCVSQNVHNRTVEEITQLNQEWEEAPSHIIRLDAHSLLHETNETAIDEIEMAGVSAESADDSPSTGSRVDKWIKQQQEDQSSNTVSKWENLSLTGEDKLDQLDGFSRKRKRSSIDDSSEISLTDYLNRQEKKLNKPGKKRVRWADLEAEKEKERRKEIGFHIGGEWTKISEEEAEGLLRGNSTIK